MAGKKGAKWKVPVCSSPTRAAAFREGIQTHKILKALDKHIDGEREMSNTQVRAAEILLRKVLPDLQGTTLSGDKDNPLQITSLKVEGIKPRATEGTGS
jgi:hypothetical protein